MRGLATITAKLWETPMTATDSLRKHYRSAEIDILIMCQVHVLRENLEGKIIITPAM